MTHESVRSLVTAIHDDINSSIQEGVKGSNYHFVVKSGSRICMIKK